MFAQTSDNGAPAWQGLWTFLDKIGLRLAKSQTAVV